MRLNLVFFLDWLGFFFFGQIFCLWVNESFQLFHHLIYQVLIVFEVIVSIDNEHLFFVILLEPLLMFIMDHLQILEWNLSFLGSHSSLSSLVTGLRATLQVNYFCFIDVGWLGEILKQMLVHFVLTILHVSQFLHQLCENVFICQNAALWDL